MISKQSRFTDLVDRVQNCRLCPRMKDRKRVLGSNNGCLDSVVVFIAEAPGRLGADKFGIPLYGDQTGRNFGFLLSSAGIKREEVFITNAVLCNPRTVDDLNDSPTRLEIQNCSFFLRDTIEIIQPKYIAPLGTKALAALGIIKEHKIKLSNDIGKLFPWNGFQIYPLYHPSPRAAIQRSTALQVSDFNLLERKIHFK